MNGHLNIGCVLCKYYYYIYNYSYIFYVILGLKSFSLYIYSKITIVDGYPSQDKLAVRIEAALADAKPELIIGGRIDAGGKNIHKEFGEMVHEFLVNLL